MKKFLIVSDLIEAMKDFDTSPKNSGNLDSEKHPITKIFVSLLLLISLLIASVYVIQLIKNTHNFDNDTMNGEFSGTIYPQQISPLSINITFDGKGNVKGQLTGIGGNNTILDGNITFSGDYVVIGLNIKISIIFNDSFGLQLIGDILADRAEIHGDSQTFYNGMIYNGTFDLYRIG